jgi:hypothetical protein
MNLPVQILDRKEQKLRTKTIALVKVLWRNHDVEEASWKLEQEMQDKYPHLFNWIRHSVSTYIYYYTVNGVL